MESCSTKIKYFLNIDLDQNGGGKEGDPIRIQETQQIVYYVCTF